MGAGDLPHTLFPKHALSLGDLSMGTTVSYWGRALATKGHKIGAKTWQLRWRRAWWWGSKLSLNQSRNRHERNSFYPVHAGLVSVESNSCDPMDYIACQAPLSMEFPRQEYWSELPFFPPGDLSNPGIKPTSPVSPELKADSSHAEPQGAFSHKYAQRWRRDWM